MGERPRQSPEPENDITAKITALRERLLSGNLTPEDEAGFDKLFDALATDPFGEREEEGHDSNKPSEG